VNVRFTMLAGAMRLRIRCARAGVAEW
jgi:hypothetical protein